MATKQINTRIKNRFDSLSKWQAEGVELLKGEIALVSVTTQQKDANGNIVNVPAVLMKVGEEGKTFNQLPWLSAKAADVYDWAKVQYAANIPITFNENGSVKETLNDYLTKVNTQSTEIANIKAIFDVIDDEQGSFVTGVTYDDNGNFTLTRGNVKTADIELLAVTEARLAEAAVTSSKIKNGAVTDDKINTVDASKVTYGTYANPASGTLPAKISEIETRLSTINTAIEGGVHFVGTTNTELVDGATATPVISGKADYKPTLGDVVLYNNKEFIWNGSAWEELGDLGRVATLETWRTNLVKADIAVAHQFVTEVDIAADGTVTIGRAQPAAEDVVYNAETVAAALARHDNQLKDVKVNGNAATVPEYVTDVLGGLDLAANQITDGGSGANFTFISEVTQNNGQISATKKTIQDASTSAKGVVQLSDAYDTDIVPADSSTAATTKAVKDVAAIAASAQTNVSAVESSYIKYNAATKHAYVGKDGDEGAKATTDYIIFDCGNATGWGLD